MSLFEVLDNMSEITISKITISEINNTPEITFNYQKKCHRLYCPCWTKIDEGYTVSERNCTLYNKNLDNLWSSNNYLNFRKKYNKD